jgi:ribosome-associated translation inhibitor RaiA
MILPVQITFRNMPPSDAVAARVQEEAEKLDEFYRRITSCRVIVEIPHRHHTLGEQFHVRIELGVPGGEIVVRHEPSLHSAVRRGDQEEWEKHLEANPTTQGHRRCDPRCLQGDATAVAGLRAPAARASEGSQCDTSFTEG